MMRAQSICSAVVLVMSASVFAQEKDPRMNPPVQPVGVESTSKAPTGVNAAPVQEKTIEKEPLSGSRWLGLGSLGGSRSYLQPSFSVSQGADMSVIGPNTTRAQTQVHAGMLLRREWQRYLIDLNYSAGGVVYGTNRKAALVQGLGLDQTISLRRWTITIGDTFSYLPESGFGAPLLGNVGNGAFGGGVGGVLNGNPLFNPAQTIITNRGSRISNSATGQVQYDVNRQLSFTGSAGYGILRFLDNAAGLLESNSLTAQAGMNYAFGRFDSMAVTYSLQQTRFKGVAGGADSHSVQLSYARRMTGRMVLQVGAGPQIRDFSIPGQTPSDRLSWTATSRVLYAMRDMDLAFAYSRFMTNGSGVLLGASTDSFDLTATRNIGRNWHTTFGSGMALNRSLAQLVAGTNQSHFRTWHANGSLGRAIGRSMSMNLTYSYQNQNQTVCGVAAICFPDTQRHVFGLMFGWRPRPIELN